jgi:hypothetical protein
VALYCPEILIEGATTIRVRAPFSGKLKVNFALEQAMKAQRGSRGIAPLFL